MSGIKTGAITVHPTDIKNMRISLTNLCQYIWRSRMKKIKPRNKQLIKLTVKEKF